MDDSDDDEEQDDDNFGLDVDEERRDINQLISESKVYAPQLEVLATYGVDVRRSILVECSLGLIDMLIDICQYVVTDGALDEQSMRKLRKSNPDLRRLFNGVNKKKSTSWVRGQMVEDSRYLPTMLKMFANEHNASPQPDLLHGRRLPLHSSVHY